MRQGRFRWLAAVVALGLGLPAGASAEIPLFPEIAMQGENGRAHFAWSWHDGTAAGIQERWRTVPGGYSERQWVTPGGEQVQLAGIGVDAAGNAAIAWVDQDHRVRMRRRDADGTLRFVQTLTPAGELAVAADVAVDPAGNASFAWIATADGQTSAVRFRRRAADGTLGPVATVSPGTDRRPRAVRIAVDPAGNALVAWENDPGGGAVVRSRRRSAGTGAWSATQTLSFANGDASELDVEVDKDGNAVFSWLFDAGTSSGVHIRWRRADGTLGVIRAAGDQLADAPSGMRRYERPNVAVGPGGGAVVAWRRFLDGPNGNYVVEARRRAPGGALSAVATISDPARNSFTPQVAVDPYGNATISWDTSGEDGFVAAVRRRAVGGALGPVHALSPAGVDVSGTNVAMDRSGAAITSWIGGTDGGLVVQARRLTAAGALGAVETLAQR